MLVEAPTYDRALVIAGRHGAELRAVAHDAGGIDPDALEDELRRDPAPAFLYLLPTFQNPTGRTIDLDRRRRLARACRRSTASSCSRTIRIGSSVSQGTTSRPSTSFAGASRSSTRRRSRRSSRPGLRVGYVVLPTALAGELEERAVSTYLAPTFPTQAIAYEFLRRGLLEANVAHVSELLLERRDALLSALERDDFRTRPGRTPDGGYFLWLELPGGGRRTGSARGRRGERSHVRPGRRVLLGPRWRTIGCASRVQLRVAGRAERSRCAPGRRGRQRASGRGGLSARRGRTTSSSGRGIRRWGCADASSPSA